jgi:hypothetical protein
MLNEIANVIRAIQRSFPELDSDEEARLEMIWRARAP